MDDERRREPAQERHQAAKPTYLEVVKKRTKSAQGGYLGSAGGDEGRAQGTAISSLESAFGGHFDPRGVRMGKPHLW